MDKNRIAQAHNPIGPTLMFRQMSGREEVSHPFDLTLELIAERNPNIDPDALLGKDITIELQVQGTGRRFFNGHVTRFTFRGEEVLPDSKLWHYEARLQPWLWYLTRESDFRIFQDKTVPQILDDVFAKYPFPVEKRIGSGHYRKWGYCVQYQETDFNFVSRLMEHEGIYYYFKHEMGRHTLVLIDDIGAHETFPGYATISYVSTERLVEAGEGYIDGWQVVKEVDSGEFRTSDFDFEKPRADLYRPRMKPYGHPHGDHAIYEWPGGYTELEDGENYAKLRLEELQALHERSTGRGNTRGLAPGYRFTLKSCPRKDQNREYLILAVNYFIRDNPYRGGNEGPAECRFALTAQPTTVPYRPPRVTPKPLTRGPQTAVVVGKSDEEIWTDKYGRVKVQFHWDRYGQADENSSCWIRVSHPWAGSNWGGMFVPRIGQEVIVDFIGGDPDYPIITGRVYNAEHMPPYELPRWKEYSTIKTHSTKGGGQYDGNELRFYDWKGKEQVFLYARWRMDLRVRWNMYQTVQESLHCGIGGAHYLTIGGNHEIAQKANLSERVEGNVGSSVGGTVGLIVDGAASAVVNGTLSISAPSIVLEAKSKISLKVGGNSVVVDNSGVTIAGTMVRINSGGFGAEASDVDIEDPGEASPADTGEPGYLDRPKTGGGWKRKRRHAGAHHGQVVPRAGESPVVTAMRQRLAQTPTGRHALDVYDRDGVAATFIPGQGSSYAGSKFGANNMNLDPNTPGDGNDSGFVHEMNHAEKDHDGSTVFGKEKSTPKEDFKSGMLNEEAEGMAKEAEYANEQAAKGTPMSNPPPYQTNYNNNYQKGVQDERARNPDATPAELEAAGKKAGTEAMRKDLESGTYVASTNGQKYPDYYGDIWTNDNKK